MHADGHHEYISTGLTGSMQKDHPSSSKTATPPWSKSCADGAFPRHIPSKWLGFCSSTVTMTEILQEPYLRHLKLPLALLENPRWNQTQRFLAEVLETIGAGEAGDWAEAPGKPSLQDIWHLLSLKSVCLQSRLIWTSHQNSPFLSDLSWNLRICCVNPTTSLSSLPRASQAPQ